MDVDADPHDRQKRISGWNQEKVSAQNVMVVGAGALGNEVVKLLLQLGVQKISLADFDVVSKANLNRCVFFSSEDAEKRALKAEVIAREARKQWSSVAVTPLISEVEKIPEEKWQEFDFVFGCLDNLGARMHANAHSYAKAVFIDGGTTGFMGKVQVVRSPGACFECGLGKKDYGRLWRKYNCVGEVVDWIDPKMPALATTTSVVAAAQVNEFIKLVHGLEKESLVGKYLFYNGLTGATAVYDVPRRADCPVHG
ncbi:MAG: ThiF family adenylyltransferase [Candidatus Micrarchaeota archaeon]